VHCDNTNEMRDFMNEYVISDISYMLRTSWVHPQGDSCVCSMVCVRTHSPAHQTAYTDECKHTVLHIQGESLAIDPKLLSIKIILLR